MNSVWKNIESPIINLINAQTLMVIGLESKSNTLDILDFCKKNDIHVSLVDAIPNFDVDEFKDEFKGIIEIYKETGISKLSTSINSEVILLNTAQEWYEVYNELKLIQKNCVDNKFPLVFLQDVCLPDINLLSKDSELPNFNKLNHNKSNNSLKPVNSIFKALDDFIGESDEEMLYITLPISTGLVILYPKRSNINDLIDPIINSENLSNIQAQERENLDVLYFESKNEQKTLKKEYLKKQQEYQNQYNNSTQSALRLEKRLEHEQIRVNKSENRIEHLNKVINGNKDLIKLSEQKFSEFTEVNKQLDILRGKLFEMEYLKYSDRSFSQKLLSKFPSLFLLLKGNTGLKGTLKNIKGYEAIKRNNLFDLSYYLKTYPDIIPSGKDPLLHYILFGYKEGRKPNPTFDGNYYLLKYKDVKNINPLVHYALYGKKEGRNTKKKVKLTKKDKIVKSENYALIADSEFFSPEWYINRYEVDPEEDPIDHYLKIGSNKLYNPNPTFNSDLYLKNNSDVAKEGISPLVHYIKYGKKEGRMYPMFEDTLLKKYSVKQQKNIKNAIYRDPPVSIIIPIYNAYTETKNCIASVLKHTNIPYEMVLIDDCSTDERIGELLDELEGIYNINVLRNETNQGFLKTVNKGFESTNGDVVILNSDTEVTYKWLLKLIVAAYSDDAIGTVTPFSDKNDIPFPEMVDENKLSIDETANLVEKVSTFGNIEAPTGNGFCLFIKRETINDVGIFDETFNQGYGEETDFSARAEANNWKNVRNDSIFIHHDKNVSFTHEKTNQMKKLNKQVINSRYPNLIKEWDEFLSSKTIENVTNNIKNALNDYDPRKIYKKRVLYVSYPDDKSGLPKINREFLNIQAEYDVIILTVDLQRKNLKLWKYRENEFLNINKMLINSRWTMEESRNLYFNLLLNLGIDALVVLKSLIISPRYKIHSSFIDVAHELGLELIYNTETLKNVVKNLKYLFESNKSNDDIISDEINKIDFSKEKMVVYTAITGNYDDLNIPEVLNPNFDYICFTDNINLKSDFWEIRLIEDLDLDNTRKARHYKILPHKYLSEYDYSLWIDGGFKIVGDLSKLINNHVRNKQMMCIDHELRNSIYDEAKACIDRKKDSPDVINSQMKKYLDEEYPEDQGLIESGVLFRKHNDIEVINVMEDWYKEIIEHSRRDQLSFNYAAWKNDFEYDRCEIFTWKNEYLSHKGAHNKKDDNHEQENVKKFDVSNSQLIENHELMSKFYENPELELNNALWFVPFFNDIKQGEIYTIFKVAQQLSIQEGTKNIFVLYGNLIKELEIYELELSEAFPNLNFKLLNKNFIKEEDLPYSDAAFCTLWNSAYYLVKYNNCKAKFYFNQDYEPALYPASSIYGLAEQSYRFGFIGITNTKGVEDSYRKYNNKFVKNFTPSIDTEIFYPNENKNEKLRILFYATPSNPRNGFYLGIEALKKVKEYFKDEIEILCYGENFDTVNYGLDTVLKNLGFASNSQDIANLYRSVDIGLTFNFTPHPTCKILEFMACGCATVTNINESSQWLLKDNENSVLTEPTVSCTAENIIKLLEDNKLREKIIMNGLQSVKLSNWETELNSLIDFIKNPK
jgi:GT2 family glycosyltransferase